MLSAYRQVVKMEQEKSPTVIKPFYLRAGKYIFHENLPSAWQSSVSRLRGALSPIRVAGVWVWVAQWDMVGVEN